MIFDLGFQISDIRHENKRRSLLPIVSSFSPLYDTPVKACIRDKLFLRV